MEQKTKHQGWNQRNVDFSKAHGNEDEAFDKLIESMNLKNGMTMGDIMSGYGAVSRKVLDYCSKNNLYVRVILTDAYEEQINKSTSYLAPYELQGYAVQKRVEDARCLSLENILDKAVIKMGLHEVPKNDQPRIIQNAYNALKEHGEIYIWESFGQTPELSRCFRELVKKKDELAGFDSFVENRHFSHETDIFKQLKEAGFRDIEIVYDGIFNYTTKNLLESDFLGDESKLQAWNEYLRSTLSDEEKKAVKFNDTGDSISMSFVKKIIRGVK
ncbi:class I SAM-dependent methyltransferase [Candidatus Pacearchaeota archaeon]|nr:class I SAM-dependent methyltransferase [Candidatus Pacearchaeota archaeon]